MLISEFRKLLLDHLGLRCVYPHASDENEGILCRAMLEVGDQSPKSNIDLSLIDGVLLEDIVIRLLITDSRADNINVEVSPDIVKIILSKFYQDMVYIPSKDSKESMKCNILNVSFKNPTTAIHPNIVCMIGYHEYNPSKASDAGYILLFQDCLKHSLNSLLRFHSETSLSFPTLGRGFGVGARDVRVRFLIYQVLQGLKFIHSQNQCLPEEFASSKIFLDDDMWLAFPIEVCPRTILCAKLMAQLEQAVSHSNATTNDEKDPDRHVGISSGSGGKNTKSKLSANQQGALLFEDAQTQSLLYSKIPKEPGYRDSITTQWTSGRISNFEYLMRVNAASGRSLVDPLHHPLFPWLTDFTVDLLGYNNGMGNKLDTSTPMSAEKRETMQAARKLLFAKHLRDLTKTKFRLSKGDAQLETTYNHSVPPHHIPESLSELTYCIYMARVMPMHILRRVVRNEFVPAHYPHSMTRMYEWSPDECIPEFFTVPSLYRSIHRDHDFLDIQLPAFADTPEKIVSYHMQLLESDEVSVLLHHWIDLTFGYCLSGEAAIENMNVQLGHTISPKERLGSAPNLAKHAGYVQLFKQKHPRKRVRHTVETQEDKDIAITPKGKYSSSRAHPASSLPSSTPSSLLVKQLLNDVALHDDKQYFTMRSNQSNDAYHAMTDQAKQAFINDTILLDGKKSLLRPVTKDPTLLTLKDVPFIDLNQLDTARECVQSVKKMEYEKCEYDFALQYDAHLQPGYGLCCPMWDGSDESWDSEGTDIEKEASYGWDRDAVDSLVQMGPHTTLHELPPTSCDACAVWSSIKTLQGIDMFTIGCIVAELYINKPLFSKNDTFELSCALRAFNSKVPGVEQGNGTMDATKVISKYYSLLHTKLKQHSNVIPLVIRRLILCLLHCNPAIRPTAREILHYCTSMESDYGYKGDFTSSSKWNTKRCRCGQTGHAGHNNASARNHRQTQQRAGVTSYLSHQCSSVFPSYFRSVFEFIGKIKLCKSGLEKFSVILDSFDFIKTLPLEGFGLALPHILNVISDPKPFREYETANSHMEIEYIHSNKDSPIVSHYITVVDLLGSRLGVDTTEKLVMPAIVEFFQKLHSPLLLRMLLYSGLWKVIIHRSGVPCFLRSFLPLLTTYLVSGTLQNISLQNASTQPREGMTAGASTGSISAFWSIFSEESQCGPDWLHFASPIAIKLVQQAAKVTLSRMSYPEYLGSGLCARYVVPSLLCLIGVPQLAQAACYYHYGFTYVVRTIGDVCELVAAGIEDCNVSSTAKTNKNRGNKDAKAHLTVTLLPSSVASLFIPNACCGSPGFEEKKDVQEMQPLYSPTVKKAIIKHYIKLNTEYDPQNMYVVRALTSISMTIGELCTAELVLAKIFHVILPNLENLLLQMAGTDDLSSAASVYAAILEVLQVLSSILPKLSPETVLEYYLQASKVSHGAGGTVSIQQLLLMIPWFIPKSVTLGCDDSEEDIDSFEALQEWVDYNRQCLVHRECSKLLVSCCMCVGADTTSELVLPAINKYFSDFVSVYSRKHKSGKPIVDIEGKIMFLGFQMGAELFVPLVQLVGAEMFYTVVPNLNPRLEMWLISINSGLVCRTPPLPSNILPEVVDISDRPNQDAKQKKGFFNWLSNKLSSDEAQADHCDSLEAGETGGNVEHSSTSTPALSSVTRKRLNYVSNRAEANELGGGDMSLDSAIMLQEFAIQMDRQSSLLMSARLKGAISDSELKTLAKDGGERGTQESADKDGKEPTSKGADMSISPNANNVLQNYASDVICDNIKHSHVNLVDMEDPPSPPVSEVDIEVVEMVYAADREAHTGGERESELESRDSSSSIDAVSSEMISSCTHPPTVTLLTSLLARSSVITTSPTKIIKCENINGVGTGNLSTGGHAGRLHSRSILPTSFLNHQNADESSNASSHGHGRSHSNAGGISVSIANTNNLGSTSAEEQIREDIYFDDLTLLLAGSAGRWNITKEVELNNPRTSPIVLSNSPTVNSKYNNSSHHATGGAASSRSPFHGGGGSVAHAANHSLKNREKFPSASVSLTAPRITLNVASEAVSSFDLGLHTNSQFAVEESVQSRIGCVAVNTVESLLLSTSRSGVKLWSLNSQPLRLVSSYNHHSYIPFCADFLRDGSCVMTCDGSISIWDVETQKTLVVMGHSHPNPSSSGSGVIAAPSFSNIPSHSASGAQAHTMNADNIYNTNLLEKCCFSYVEGGVSPRNGISPGLNSHGDNQIMGCYNMNVAFFDVRLPNHTNSLQIQKPLRSVAEWKLPLALTSAHPNTSVTAGVTAAVSGNTSANITCATSFEHYVVSGSSNGGIYVVDRRSGRLLYDAHGHDSSIVKLFPLQGVQFMSITDKTGIVWECGEHALKKLYCIKGMPDSSAGLSLNTVLLEKYDNVGGTSAQDMHSMLNSNGNNAGSSLKCVNKLYCLSGHKMSMGTLPTYTKSSYQVFNSLRPNSNASVNDDLKLNQVYFTDRYGNKITKQRLHVTSSVMLPLRRLLLVGTDDGTIKVVS